MSLVDHRILEVDDDKKIDRVGLLTEEILNNDKSKSRTQHVVKAHITSLVSALGGPDHSSGVFPPPYKLGINALVVLKDLKRWLKFDSSSGKWDVALAIGETTLVTNDLLQILRNWELSYSTGEVFDEGNENIKLYRDRIAGLCLEILVPLTWPLELEDHKSTINQVILYNKIKGFQLQYKKFLLEFDNGIVFKAIVRQLIPIISKPKHQRQARDNSIINLCVMFFRNILCLQPDSTEFEVKTKKKNNKAVQSISNLPSDVSLEDISLNVMLRVLEKNKVLKFLLTFFAGIGKEFDQKILGFGALECLYFLTNGVKVTSVFKSVNEQIDNNNESDNPNNKVTAAGLKLTDLLKKENKLKSQLVKEAGSRHSRFGSLLSFDTAEAGRLAISGQKALISVESTIESLDKSKKWNARKQRIIGQSETFDTPDDDENEIVYLDEESRIALLNFAEKFMDGGFNQFVEIVGRLLQGDQASDLQGIQYCLMISWFLEFQRIRQEHEEISKKSEKPKIDTEKDDEFDGMDFELVALLKHNKPGEAQEKENEDVNDEEEEEELLSDFGLVGGVLIEDNLQTLIVFLKREAELSDVSLCHAVLVALKEILVLLTQMTQSKYEKDVDNAINIFKKIFTDEEFLNSLILISRKASNKNLKFIVTLIDLLDIIFKTLSSISKTTKLVIVKKSKVKDKEENARRKFKQKVTDFEFSSFFNRFIQESIVDTYMRIFQNYEKVDLLILKKCLKFFHRVFFVFKKQTIVFRLDFIKSFHEILNRRNCFLFDNEKTVRYEFEDFFKYFMKTLRYHLDKSPVLAIELLFPKFPHRINYFDTGDPNEVIKSSKKVRTEDELNELPVVKPIEFRPSLELSFDQQFGILITGLSSNSKTKPILDYLKKDFENFINNWESMKKLNFIDDNFRFQVIRSASLRLLLRMCGFKLPENYGDICELDETISKNHLEVCLEYLKKYLLNLFVFKDGERISSYTRKVIGYEDQYSEGEENDYYDDNINDGDISEKENEQVGDMEHHLKELESQLSNKDLPNRTKQVLELELHELRLQMVEEEARKAGKRKKRKLKSRKKVKRRRIENEENPVSDSDDEPKLKKKKPKNGREKFTSAMYINSDDDEDDDEADALFFKREQKLRDFINLHGGQISKEQYKEFNVNFHKGEYDSDNDITMIHGNAAEPIESRLKSVASDNNESNKPERIVEEDDDYDEEEETTVRIPKTKKVISDDEDDYDEPSETAPIEEDDVSASKRRPRNIIDDDDDDDEYFDERKEADTTKPIGNHGERSDDESMKDVADEPNTKRNSRMIIEDEEEDYEQINRAVIPENKEEEPIKEFKSILEKEVENQEESISETKVSKQNESPTIENDDYKSNFNEIISRIENNK